MLQFDQLIKFMQKLGSCTTNVLFYNYLLTSVILMTLLIVSAFIPFMIEHEYQFSDSSFEAAITSEPFKQWLLVSIFVALPMILDQILDWNKIFAPAAEFNDWLQGLLLSFVIIGPNFVMKVFILSEYRKDDPPPPSIVECCSGIIAVQSLFIVASIFCTLFRSSSSISGSSVSVSSVVSMETRKNVFFSLSFEESCVIGLLLLTVGRVLFSVAQIWLRYTGIYICSQLAYYLSFIIYLWVIGKVLWNMSKYVVGLQFFDHYLLADFWRMSLLVFFCLSVGISYGILRLGSAKQEDLTQDFVVYNLVSIVFLTCLLTLVPSRSYKLLAELKRQQLETRLNLIRYVSHEMRTPLNTAFMGLTMVTLELQDLKDQFTSSLKSYDKVRKYTKKDDQEINQEEYSKNLNKFFRKINRFLSPEFLNDTMDTIQHVTDSCHVALQTLDDLLTFDKLDEKKLVIEMTEIDPWTFVTKTAKPFEINAQHAGVLFNVEMDTSDLEMSNFVIKADQFKLSQVLRNLISNALKFTPRNGEVRVAVQILKNTLSSDEAENMLRVSVKDTGPGISKENQKKLFGQYVQFNAAKLQQGKGSGLGLWITKSIVQLHLGRVSAESEGEGHGSFFFFDLPLYPTEKNSSFREDGQSNTDLTSREAHTETKLNDRLPMLRGDDSSSVSTNSAVLKSDRSIDLEIGMFASGTPESRTKKTFRGIEIPTLKASSFQLLDVPVVLTQRSSKDCSEPEEQRKKPAAVNMLFPPKKSQSLTAYRSLYQEEVENHDLLFSELDSRRYKRKLSRSDSDISILSWISSTGKRPEDNDTDLSPSETSSVIAELNQRISKPKTSEDPVRRSSGQQAATDIFETLGRMKSSQVHTSQRYNISAKKVFKEVSARNVLEGKEENNELDVDQISWSRGLRVMIVDDSAPTRKVCGKLLTRCGHTTVEVEDGRACVDMIEKISSESDGHNILPQVILLDDNMPRLRGPATVAELRKGGFQGLIFGVTGTVDEKETKRFLEEGADAVFSKPLNIQLLKAHIESV